MSMLNWLKNKRNKKGFSLVELIIVIAILAILVGVLAPQYLKYVEKSRKSTDASNLDSLVNAVKVAAADVDYNIPAGKYTITIKKDKTTVEYAKDTTSGASSTATSVKDTKVLDALNASTNYKFEDSGECAKLKLKSNRWNSVAGGDSTNGTIKAVITISDNSSVSVEYTPASVLELAN